MKPNAIASIRNHCVAVFGYDPMLRGATPDQMKDELETYLQTNGARVRAHAALPCHCYEHCEDDDNNQPRRQACRKRD